MSNVKTYPRFKHHPTKGSIIAKTAEAEKNLGPGWYESRADFPKVETCDEVKKVTKSIKKET